MEASSIGIPHNVGLETMSTIEETRAASNSKTEASPLEVKNASTLESNKRQKARDDFELDIGTHVSKNHLCKRALALINIEGVSAKHTTISRHSALSKSSLFRQRKGLSTTSFKILETSSFKDKGS